MRSLNQLALDEEKNREEIRQVKARMIILQKQYAEILAEAQFICFNGNEAKAKREELNITLIDFATSMGICPSHLYRLEKNERTWSPKQMKAWLNSYNSLKKTNLVTS